MRNDIHELFQKHYLKEKANYPDFMSGDFVKVIHHLETYTDYIEAVNKLNLKNWKKNETPTENGKYQIISCVVLAKVRLYGIKNLETEKEYVVNNKAFIKWEE